MAKIGFSISSVEDIASCIAERREKLIRARDAEENSRASLQSLYQKIASRNHAFDDEDRECVTAELRKHEERLANIDAQIMAEEEQRSEREDLYRTMFEAIRKRAEILEEDEACLSSHPDMLRFFAKKQVMLRKLLANRVQGSPDARADQTHEQRAESGLQP